MDWEQELDALIESTLALVKDVKPQSTSVSPIVGIAEQALSSKPVLRQVAIVPMTRRRSERDEILQRVSNFRAHQDKMAWEREDHYLQARAKMLAALSQRPGRHSEEMPDCPKQNPRRS